MKQASTDQPIITYLVEHPEHFVSHKVRLSRSLKKPPVALDPSEVLVIAEAGGRERYNVFEVVLSVRDIN